MKSLIIFDFDGTIANTEEAAYAVYEQMTKQYNIQPMSKTELQSIKKLPLRKRIQSHGIPLYRLPKLILESQTQMSHFMEETHPFEGIPMLLENLKKHKKLIIVSSNKKNIIKDFLKRHKLNHFIKVYGGAAIFGKDKTIQKAIHKMKVDLSHSIYIGDETRDIEACKSLGLDMIAVTWGYDDQALLVEEKAPYVARTVDELLQIIYQVDLSHSRL
jgi:phosphoglycolate phosphatase